MRREIHSHGGVSYEISAVEREGGFAAFWACQSCNFAGTISRTYPTEDEALEAAKAMVASDRHSAAHLIENGCRKRLSDPPAPPVSRRGRL